MKRAADIAIIVQNAFEQFSIQRIATRAFAIMRNHALEGKYIGGDLKDKGYSTKTITASKLGKVSFNKGITTIKPIGRRKVDVPSSSILWRKVDGESQAYLVGGYKKFRNLIGLNTAFVDLNFSSQMMPSFRIKDVDDSGLNKVATFGVSPANEAKAANTNERRQWMALSEAEVDQVEKMLISDVNKILGI